MNRGLAATSIQITGNQSTSRCIINVAANYQVDYTQSNTVRLIMGFNIGIFPTVIPPDSELVTGQNVATFNSTNSIFITSNIAGPAYHKTTVELDCLQVYQFR